MGIEAPENYRQLAEAMQLLDFWCSSGSGSGFKIQDAGYGRALAEKSPERWSHKMAAIAWRFARKYRRQLASGWIDIDDIVEPTPRQSSRIRTSKAEHYTARLEGGILRLTSDGFPGWQALGAVKSITGRSSDKKKVPGGETVWVWRVPLSSADEIMAAVRAGYIRVDGPVRAELAAMIAQRRESIQASQRVSASVEIKGLGGILRPFQGAGVTYAARAKIPGTAVVSTFFADEMGLGKTVQALAVVHMQGCRRVVAVVPASLKLNWAREARKWIPSLRHVQVLEGRHPHGPHPEADFVIINYDILSSHVARPGKKKARMPWVEQLVQWAPEGVIVDESHYCKNPKAQRTVAVTALANHKSVRVRLALTGTPVENQPSELIPQLRILGRLGDMGGWKLFAERYCTRGQWGGFGRGGRNLTELNTKMRAGGFYVRRLKADVLTELPPKVRVRLPIPIDRRRYDRVMRQSASRIEEAAREIKLAKLEGRRPPGSAMAAKLTSITELRMAVAQAKLDAALSWCRSQMDQGEKLVIFAHHTSVVKSIGEEFSCPIIHGETPQEARQAAVDRFQDDPSCQAIGLNIKSGGVGLTLTASTNVVFIESGWTPGANDQAEDRCHRIGQTGSVTAWYLEAVDTIDQWLLDLVDEKREVVDAATDGDARREPAEAVEEKNMVDRLADLITETARD